MPLERHFYFTNLLSEKTNHPTLGRHVTNQSVTQTLAKHLAHCVVSTQNTLAVKCQVRKKRSKQAVLLLIKANLECSVHLNVQSESKSSISFNIYDTLINPML